MNNNPFNRNRRGFSPVYDPTQGYPEEQQRYPMGQYLSTLSPVKPETIPQYDTAASKKILGMPVDRFSSLLGTLAAAIAPGTAQGRFGAGMVRMGDMMRQERMYQGRQESAAIEAKRKAETKGRERLAKVPSGWESVYKEMEGQINPKTGRPYTATEKYAAFKKIGEKKPPAKKEKAPTIRTFRIGDMDVQHEYDYDAKEWKPIPGMPGKKVKPPTEEKPITADKARERLFAIAKFKSSLAKTGGWNETIFELMAQKDPEFAKRALSISSSKAEVNETIKELEDHYKGIISGKPKAKKEEEFDIEIEDARDAINQGIPADRVREMYKRRTGKELGL